MARTSEVIYQCEYGEYVLPDGVDVEAYLAEHRERINAELKQRARLIPGAYVEPDIERNV
jgi:trehalose-6-phosphatase